MILRHWKLESLEGLTPEADEARTRCIRQIERVGKAGRRFARQRAEQLATASV